MFTQMGRASLLVAMIAALFCAGCLEVGIALAGTVLDEEISPDDDDDYGYGYDEDPYYFSPSGSEYEVNFGGTAAELGAAGLGSAYFAVFWANESHSFEDDRYVAGFGYAGSSGYVSGFAFAPRGDESAASTPSVGSIVFLSDEEPCPQAIIVPVPSAERTLAQAPQHLVYVPEGVLDASPFEEGISCALPGDAGGVGLLAGLVPVDCETAFSDVGP